MAEPTDDIDFTPAGVRARIEPGLVDARDAIAHEACNCKFDALDGMLVREHPSMADAMPP